MGNMSEQQANAEAAKQSGPEPAVRRPLFSGLRARLLARHEPVEVLCASDEVVEEARVCLKAHAVNTDAVPRCLSASTKASSSLRPLSSISCFMRSKR